MIELEDCIGAMPDALLVVEEDGRIVMANPEAMKLWAAPWEDLRGRHLAELVESEHKHLEGVLRQWSRSTDSTPAVLPARYVAAPTPGDEGNGNGNGSVMRVDGQRLRRRGEAPDASSAYLLLRCRKRQSAAERFRLLSEQVQALTQEVVTRRRAELNIERQRKWLATTLGSIGDAVIATDPQLRVVYMNPVAVKLTGWSVEQAEGQFITRVFHIVDERTGEPVPNPCETVLSEDRVVELANHTALRRANGQWCAIEDTAAPIHDDEGRIQGVVLVFHDVTERRRAEQAVREQREWFRTTLGSIGDAVIATDTQGRVTYMNPVAEGLTGWATADAEGVDSLKVFDIINEETRELVESPIARVLREGVVVGLANHTLLRARDGTERPIDDSGAPIRNADGEMVGVVLVFHDVSERKAAEEQLRESERRFRTMADAAPVMIWLTDVEGEATYFNDRWVRFTGEPMETHVGGGWVEASHPDDADRVRRTYEQALGQRQAFRLEYRMRRHDGAYRWVTASAVPRHDVDGAFGGYVASVSDITERRDAEAQLVAINELLEKRVVERTRQLRKLASELTQAEQRERRRLAQTLHDHLQQLLAAAKMRMDVLRRQVGEPSAEAVQAGEGEMAAAHASVDEVELLLNQSIEASRSLTVELSPPILYDAGLGPSVPWLARQMRERHGLTVETELSPEAEPADEEIRVLLFEALRELLFNTVKHGGTDRATVQLSRTGDGWVRLRVSDEGKGFDPSAVKDTIGDHGFGLFSIRERLEFLGGRMEVESQPKAGTRVTVLAPSEATAQGDAAALSRAQQEMPELQAARTRQGIEARGLRVLLADDHEIVREGLAVLLSAWDGIEVVGEAADGHQAVEQARQLQPDVLVMDVSMPGMNGVEATRLIKQHMPHVRVVALSMHQEVELGEAICRAGAVVYLPKDGPVEELVKAIRGEGRKD